MSSESSAPGMYDDLAVRFRCARRAALLAVLGVRSADAEAKDEATLLDEALASDAARTHKLVFEHSLKLGWGFTRFYGLALSLLELPAVLGKLEVSCWTGRWDAPSAGTVRLERRGCVGCRRDVCDTWREAQCGLVLGLGQGVYHARHRSRGAGDDRCVDVLYDDPEAAERFGPIPEDMQPALDRVIALARSFDSQKRVEFLGLSEGVLFYRETSLGPATEAGVGVRSLIESTLKRRFPQLRLQDAAPRSVFGTA